MDIEKELGQAEEPDTAQQRSENGDKEFEQTKELSTEPPDITTNLGVCMSGNITTENLTQQITLGLTENTLNEITEGIQYCEQGTDSNTMADCPSDISAVQNIPMEVNTFINLAGDSYVRGSTSITVDNVISGNTCTEETSAAEINLFVDNSVDVHGDVINETENNGVEIVNNNLDEPHGRQSESAGNGPETKSQNRGRKRSRDSENWKRNVRNKSRVLGQSYITRRNKLVAPKTPKPHTCHCRYKCAQKFTQNVRDQLCSEFYKLGTWIRQNDYICSTVIANTVSRRTVLPNGELKSTKRKISMVCSFMVEDIKHRVCQHFYMKTLSISSKRIRRAMKEKGNTNVFDGSDKRSGKVPKNKTSDAQIQNVRRHIDSFPRLESHYCRRDTSAQYLSPELDITKLYRLYRNEFCLQEGIIDPVSERIYRQIFVTQYNLRFYVPKKDQCSQCNAYKKGTPTYQEAEKASWEAHKAREKEAMDTKESDKRRSFADKSYKAITFDLQAVLYTPYTGDCQIFYKRKLAVYNFTIHEAATKNGTCFIWNETEGKRGALEISTALIIYMRSLPQEVTHVSSFSDTCAGQIGTNSHVQL